MSDSEQTKKKVMVAVIAAAVVVSLIIMLKSRGGARVAGPNAMYFYDLTSGKLFTAKKGQLPPIDAPGGAGKGVRAVVLSCGACSENDRQVGYLEMFTDKARAGLAALTKPGAATPQMGQDIESGTLVAKPPANPGDEPNWVVKTSPEGRGIVQVEMSLCSPNLTKHCSP